MTRGPSVHRLIVAAGAGLGLAASYAGCVYTWPLPAETGSGGGGGATSTSTSTSSSGGGGGADAGDGGVSGLIATWSFEEDGGAVAIDGTGHGHDAFLQDGATRVPAGHKGWGVSLDRMGGEVLVPSLDGAGFPSDQGSLVMWVKADYTSPSFNQFLFSQYVPPHDAGPDGDVGPNKLSIYGGARDAGPAIYFLFVRAKDAAPWWGPPPVPVLNSQYYRIAVGWDLRHVDGGMRAFKAVGDDYQSADVPASASLDGQDFRLGHALGGIIDEISLFDHMLTQSELSALQ